MKQSTMITAPVIALFLVLSTSVLLGQQTPAPGPKKTPLKESPAPVKKNAPVKKAVPVNKTAPLRKAVPVNKTAPAKKAAPSPAVPKKDSPADENRKKTERDKKKAEWVEKTLRYGINKDRREAINIILDIKDDSVRKGLESLLVETLRDENDADVLVKAITVAGELKLAAAEPHMVKALEDESEDVRIAAVNGLRQINAVGSKAALAAKLKAQDMTRDSNFTEALIDTLSAFKAADLAPFAEQAIKDIKNTRNVRQKMVLFLGRVGSAAEKDFLLKLLKDEEEDTDIRSYAANSLGHLGVREAAAEIDKVITTIEAYPFKKKKDYYNLYLYCVAALVKLGDQNAFPRLMSAMKSDSTATRLRAVKLMGELKDKRSIDILKYKSEHDPNTGVQKAAREALKDMGIPDEKER